MDQHFSTGCIPPLKLLYTQILLGERSRVENFRFIKRSLLDENRPVCYDFYTNEEKSAGQAPKPTSKITFRHLIDQTLFEPLSMFTSVVDAEKVTSAGGQEITLFTAVFK